MYISTDVLYTTAVVAMFLLTIWLYMDKKRFNKKIMNEMEEYQQSQRTDTVEDLIVILDALPSCYTLLSKEEVQEVGTLINQYHTIIYHDKDIDNLRKTAITVRHELKTIKRDLLTILGKDAIILDDKGTYIRNNVRLLSQMLFLYQATAK